MQVYLNETKVFSDYVYTVYVEGEVYQTFFSRVPLTQSDMIDVASYYREALDAPVDS